MCNNESLDIDIDFNKASNKWMLNKLKTSSKTYKYYCKYPKCIGYRMLYPKNNINYKLNIYSDYCKKHTNKYDNTKIYKNKYKKVKNNNNLHPNSIPNIPIIDEYNKSDEIIVDEYNKSDEIIVDEIIIN